MIGTQTRQSSSRNISADSLRGIAAVLVIAGHLIIRDVGDAPSANHFRNLLYCFHMPVFFFWAGYFQKNGFSKGFLPFAGQKALRLLVPYVTWSSVAVVAKVFLALLQGTPIVWADQAGAWLHTVLYADSVWFFLSLFSMHLLFWLLNRLFVRNRILAYAAAALIYLIPLPSFLSLHNTQAMMPYFAIGILAGTYSQQIVAWIKSKKWVPWAAIALMFLAAPAADWSYQWRLGYGWHLPASGLLSIVFSAALGFVFEMLMAKASAVRKLFSIFGKYSMEIYCLHMMFVNYIPLSLPAGFAAMPEIVSDAIYFVMALVIAGICTGLSFALLNRIPIYRWFMLGQFPHSSKTRKERVL